MKIILLVGLKIPDTTAITTFNTLKKLGYGIKKLSRREYFEFEVDESVVESAMVKIPKTDILVNSNKNSYLLIKGELNQKKCALITDSDIDYSGFKKSLCELGLNVKSVKKGVLWLFESDSETMKKATLELLFNKHYQECKFF